MVGAGADSTTAAFTRVPLFVHVCVCCSQQRGSGLAKEAEVCCRPPSIRWALGPFKFRGLHVGFSRQQRGRGQLSWWPSSGRISGRPRSTFGRCWPTFGPKSAARCKEMTPESLWEVTLHVAPRLALASRAPNVALFRLARRPSLAGRRRLPVGQRVRSKADLCRNGHRGRVSDPDEPRQVVPCVTVVKGLGVHLRDLAF